MDQSTHLWSHRSPKACRNRGSHKGADQTPRFPHSAHKDDHWETDPDCVNDASRQYGEQEVSTASIISDLSRSIRECGLRRSDPHNKKQHADHQSPLCSYQDSSRVLAKDPKGQRTPLCPQVRSSPSLCIERSSVFNRNAAETLDTFFSEKLKASTSNATQLSDSYENMETPQEPTSHGRCQRRTRKTHAEPERTSTRQNPSQPVPARGVMEERACNSWDYHEPGIYYGHCLRHDPLSKGEMPRNLLERQESKRSSTTVSSSARILPRCRISHVQSCRDCQAFNQEMPAGKEEAFYEWREEDRSGRRASSGKGRTGASSQQRLCKVQRWLEQSPTDEHPKAEEQTRLGVASPRALERRATYGSLEPKAGDPLDRAREAGDCWSLENPADPRHRRKAHKARSPGHQRISSEARKPHNAPVIPAAKAFDNALRLLSGEKGGPVARIVACDDTSRSPAACSCLFCEHQKGRAKSAPAKKRTDPSVQEVAVQLQAEERVPRIVEAFERRSRREAKMAERDRTFQPSRHKDLEKRAQVAKSQGGGKQASKTRKSRSKEEQDGQPRPGGGPEGHSKRSHGQGQLVGNRPSFMDRLRGLY